MTMSVGQPCTWTGLCSLGLLKLLLFFIYVFLKLSYENGAFLFVLVEFIEVVYVSHRYFYEFPSASITRNDQSGYSCQSRRAFSQLASEEAGGALTELPPGARER